MVFIDEVPEGIPYILIKKFYTSQTCLNSYPLSATEVLNKDHAKNTFGWANKIKAEFNPGEAFMQFRKAPAFTALQAEAGKRNEDAKRREKEQKEKDEAAARGQREVARSGGGALGDLARSVQLQRQVDKGIRRAGVSGVAAAAKAAAPRVAQPAGVPATPPAEAVLRLSGRGSAASGKGGVAPGRVAHSGSVQLGSKAAASPHSKVAEPYDANKHEAFSIGNGRRGSMGRALKTVDLTGCLFGVDPGREIASARERLPDLRSDQTAFNVEEAFLETALAGKAWALSGIAATRTADLVTFYNVLKKNEKEFILPFDHRIAFTRKVASEYAHEGLWDKWRLALTPETDQTPSSWNIRAPRFPGLENLDDLDLALYKESWHQTCLCNGVLAPIADVTETDWKGLRSMCDAWYKDDAFTDAMEADDKFSEMAMPFWQLFSALRVVCDPFPFAGGGTALDVSYVWPAAGEKDTCEDQFAFDVKSGRSLVRTVSKNDALTAKVILYKQFTGAEAAIGREWERIHNELVSMLQQHKDPRYATPRGDHDVHNTLKTYILARTEAVDQKRLRPGASKETDTVVHDLLRILWKKTCEEADFASRSLITPQFLQSITAFLSEASALHTKITDHIAEAEEIIRKNSLDSALDEAVLSSMDDCTELLSHIAKCTNVSKTDDVLEKCRKRFDEIYELLAKVLNDGDPITLDSILPALKLLDVLVAEPGVIATSTDIRKHSDLMKQFVQQLVVWRSTVHRLSSNPESTEKDAMLAMDAFDAISHAMSGNPETKFTDDSVAKGSFQDLHFAS